MANAAVRGQDVPIAICMDSNLQVNTDQAFQTICSDAGFVDAARLQGSEIAEASDRTLEILGRMLEAQSDASEMNRLFQRLEAPHGADIDLASPLHHVATGQREILL